jgi:hypothetical protein
VEGVRKLAGVRVGAEEEVEGGGGEGEVPVDLGEVREERLRGAGGEERAGGGEATSVSEDVEELGVSEWGRAVRGEAEEVEGGVGVEADAPERRVEEGVRERGGGEEAGGGGEAVEKEETSETAEKSGVGRGAGLA